MIPDYRRAYEMVLTISCINQFRNEKCIIVTSDNIYIELKLWGQTDYVKRQTNIRQHNNYTVLNIIKENLFFSSLFIVGHHVASLSEVQIKKELIIEEYFNLCQH